MSRAVQQFGWPAEIAGNPEQTPLSRRGAGENRNAFAVRPPLRLPGNAGCCQGAELAARLVENIDVAHSVGRVNVQRDSPAVGGEPRVNPGSGSFGDNGLLAAAVHPQKLVIRVRSGCGHVDQGPRARDVELSQNHPPQPRCRFDVLQNGNDRSRQAMFATIVRRREQLA